MLCNLSGIGRDYNTDWKLSIRHFRLSMQLCDEFLHSFLWLRDCVVSHIEIVCYIGAKDETLTYYMEQCLTWEADSFSAVKKFPHFIDFEGS